MLAARIKEGAGLRRSGRGGGELATRESTGRRRGEGIWGALRDRRQSPKTNKSPHQFFFCARATMRTTRAPLLFALLVAASLLLAPGTRADESAGGALAATSTGGTSSTNADVAPTDRVAASAGDPGDARGAAPPPAAAAPLALLAGAAGDAAVTGAAHGGGAAPPVPSTPVLAGDPAVPPPTTIFEPEDEWKEIQPGQQLPGVSRLA